jgi:hypothetical protein
MMLPKELSGMYNMRSGETGRFRAKQLFSYI